MTFRITKMKQLKLDRIRRKGSEMCLRYNFYIYAHAFSRWCSETSNMTSLSQRGTIMRKIHRARPQGPKTLKLSQNSDKMPRNPKFDTFHKIKIAIKLEKSTDLDHNLMSSESGLHAKFQPIPSMRSLGNARKLKTWPVSQSQSAKRREINGLWS